jgi:nucleoside-diphosphate-sugar epimerase
MEGLTILGGKGFVGGQYVKDYYHPAIGNIASVNEKNDYNIYSPDVLYFISTVHNFNVVLGDAHIDINTNLNTLIKVLEYWRKTQTSGVFNFISSWFVYEAKCGAKETDPCKPKGFYSITKKCAEDLLISYCETFGLNYRILRLGNVVGPGDTKISNKKNALQFVASQLKEGNPVELRGSGFFYRDYIHVEDCSRAIELVLAKGEINSIYNIGNGRTWPFLTIVDFLHKELNSTSPLVYNHTLVDSFYMDTTKLKELGYAPQYTGEKLYRSLLQ